MISWYDATLLAHSANRWLVLVVALMCIARAAGGWFRRRPYDRTDERLIRAFVAVVDTQLLLGLVLYLILSPIGAAALLAPGMLWNAILRFFAFEHPLIMLIGFAVLHVGVVRAKRLGDAPERHRAFLKTVALAFACFLAGIPWPGLAYARPLVRWR